MVKFTVSTKKHGNLEFILVEFQIDGGVIEPSELSQLSPPEVPLGKGVVISGRGPIWLYAFLVHHFHPAKFVATFDPRLKSGVVVESHTKDVGVGDLIPV